ncbi:SIS domain-containing protein [Martelella mediterranea]|uniref:Glutamine--fructose-6-phosphate transaminase n=1 Tax=Martelella mediterranea TaxID=293089 RepID=A0A4V2V4I6_9HYPH|nr:SIS domain-containing protein [Martelella mediterranea]TCT39910.1 glutamine--fructose-6-phosphate transaminase [Martelella mediterranea]
MSSETHMHREIAEIPVAARRFLDEQKQAYGLAGKALRDKDPSVVVTVARGSSDHAALFLKYAIELTIGVPVASLGPSLASIFEAPLKLQGGAAFCISQSGKSPDIVAMGKAARAGGALTISLVNTISSPLAEIADQPIDIAAGPERAVAATKSYVNSVVAGLAVLAEWADDDLLRRALEELPASFERALALDWAALLKPLEVAQSLYVLGRGPTFAIASEAALKCKETCELHAEAYSSAEVMHGPVSLVEKAFPVIAFAAGDKAESSIAATASGMAGKGANVFLSSLKGEGVSVLPAVETGHPLTDALALIVPYYRFIEQLSRARGFNPDSPVALNKVTETE